jgi:hypothetical protein
MRVGVSMIIAMVIMRRNGMRNEMQESITKEST